VLDGVVVVTIDAAVLGLAEVNDLGMTFNVAAHDRLRIVGGGAIYDE
jgi:hypothetical protein